MHHTAGLTNGSDRLVDNLAEHPITPAIPAIRIAGEISNAADQTSERPECIGLPLLRSKGDTARDGHDEHQHRQGESDQPQPVERITQRLLPGDVDQADLGSID